MTVAHVVVVRPGVDPDVLGPGPALLVDAGAGLDRTDVLRLGEDIGRAAAVNRAVAGLDPAVEWIALADPGVVWCPGAVDALLAAAAANPRAGALGPRLLDPHGADISTGGQVPSVPGAARARSRPDPGRVGWLPASALLLRRAAFESVDGFDPRYLDEWDEVDFGDRIGRAGWLVLHVPGAEAVVHPVGGPGMLEPRGAGLRRFVYDRGSAPARALLRIAGLGRR